MSTLTDLDPTTTTQPEGGALTNVAPPAKESVMELQTDKKGQSGTLRYLRQDEWSAWDKLVDASPQGSPFTRSWWLRAVGGTVRILAYFKDEHLLAGIPLHWEKRFGVTVCTMPMLTQTLGPMMEPPNGRPVNAVRREEMEILSVFAEELAKQSVFFQAFHPSVQNWSPFYWNGFSQTSRATQILDLRALDEVLAGMTSRSRNALRNAERGGVTITPCGPDEVWRAEEKSFARQHMAVPHSLEYLSRLYRWAKENHAGECFAAVDHEQRVHSAAFMVWDRRRAYAVAMGGDPDLRIRGSTSLLVWHMIQFAAERSPIFDFAGSMLQSVELFNRKFGTTQVPYSWIMKFPVGLKMYLALRGKL